MYAARQDIVDRIGIDELHVLADRDRDEIVDEASITQALLDASTTIDTYVSRRYPVPLSPVPGIAKTLCVTIAVYFLADRAGAVTEERRKRYEDAIKLLERMASGEVGLGVPPSGEEVPTGDVKGEILAQSEPRVFGRSRSGGLP